MALHHSFPFVSIDLSDSVAGGCCHDSNIDVSLLHSDIIEVFDLVAVTMVMMIELNENVVCLIGYCCCYCCCGCCYTDNLVFGLMFLAVLWCPVTESL